MLPVILTAHACDVSPNVSGGTTSSEHTLVELDEHDMTSSNASLEYLAHVRMTNDWDGRGKHKWDPAENGSENACTSC